MLSALRKRFSNFRQIGADSPPWQQLQQELLAESTLDPSYLVLIVGSCAIATFGLLANSAAVIIGAMIIAPLMLPIRGLAFGALEGDIVLVRRGAIAIGVGTLLAIALAWGIGRLVGIPGFDSEVLARSKPTLLDLGIAVAAGGISGYAKIQPKVSGSLAGTAIAVALMPPICVVGLGLSQANWSLSFGATLLYFTNLLGITLSCMLTFLLAGYTSFRRARRALTWALAFTSILLIPLGLSFARLVRQAQLEKSLQRALLNRTITFQRLELLSSQTDWLIDPPEVRLNVRAKEPITPRQVQLLEQFIEREMGQPFTLVFLVGQVQEIRRDSSMSENDKK
jgi:Predicted membrane protein